MKKVFKLFLGLVFIGITICLGPELSFCFAQPIDINFDGDLDMMTSLRFQRHIWTADDGTVGIAIQRGSLGGIGENGLVFIRSVDDGATWDFVAQIDDSFNSTVDGIIDAMNRIWLVVSTINKDVNDKYDVKLVLLDYDYVNRTWFRSREVVIFNSASATGGVAASIARDSLDRLWVSFRYYNSADYWIVVVYSDDNGFTWEKSNQSFGTRNSSWNKFGKLIAFDGRIGLIYHDFDGVSNLKRWAYRNDSDAETASWTKSDIGTVSKDEKWGSHFSATVDYYAAIHLVYADYHSSIVYQRYDGNWSLPSTIYTGGSNYPNITTDGDNLWVFFMQTFTQIYDYKQNWIAYRKYTRADNLWDEIFSYVNDTFERTFDKKIIPPPPYTRGKSVYLGLLERFDYVSFNVTVGGAGGNVVWEYWNGSQWMPLTILENENPAFNNIGYGFVRFEIPSDWQTITAPQDVVSYYAVKISIIADYLNNPVVNAIATIRNNKRPAVPDRIKDRIPIIWQEGAKSPFNIRYNHVEAVR